MILIFKGQKRSRKLKSGSIPEARERISKRKLELKSNKRGNKTKTF